MRTGNLLTGQQYVALEFVPKPARVAFDATAQVPTLPTVPGALADVQPQLAEIVARLSRVRFDDIGTDLQAALKAVNRATVSLQTTLASADSSIKQLTPEAQAAVADMRQALAQANQTLASAQATLRSAEANVTDSQAPLQRNANQALAELQRAAQALRVLADYLQRASRVDRARQARDAVAAVGGQEMKPARTPRGRRADADRRPVRLRVHQHAGAFSHAGAAARRRRARDADRLPRCGSRCCR